MVKPRYDNYTNNTVNYIP
ncbi:MAG: hypothetical protein ACIPMY_00710 [Rickettsia endosymbiont of Pentastiridius leporinus]